jgi:hypothetical protein
MRENISSMTGRLVLLTIVSLGLVLSIASLFWIGRDGGIRPELQRDGTIDLVAFYVPYFFLMGAFYFGEGKKRAATRSLEPFIFAVVITIVWMVTPICSMLLTNWAIQDIFRFLEKIRVLGDSAALAALGYYFSKKDDAVRTRPARATVNSRTSS